VGRLAAKVPDLSAGDQPAQARYYYTIGVLKMQDVTGIIDVIEVEEYDGLVFNLETEDGEYVVSNVVVHNCPHNFVTYPAKWAPDDCPLLWMGE